MYTRPMKRLKRSRRTKWVDRQIDEALLGIAMQASFLYAHRRARRALPKVALGAVVVTGVGAAAAATAAAAAAAATVAGVGAVGAAGGAAAWYRRRSKKSSATASQAAAGGWRPSGIGSAPVKNSGSHAGDEPVTVTESLTTD